jgi:hypothetical protein
MRITAAVYQKWCTAVFLPQHNVTETHFIAGCAVRTE